MSRFDLIAGLMDQSAELVKNRREIEKLQEQISLVHIQLHIDVTCVDYINTAKSEDLLASIGKNTPWKI